MKEELFESIESSSPTITRSVAANLLGNYCSTISFPSWQKVVLEIIGLLPQSIGRSIISRFQAVSGLPSNLLDHFSIKSILEQRLNDYAQLKGPFDCLTMGVGLGGAADFLSSILGGPFLPQTFVFTLKGGTKLGDVNEYLNRSRDQAIRIAEENPEIITIQHFDPIHDGWLTRYVNHLRYKLISLPAVYKEFIKRYLNPGGTLVYFDCQAEWLRYQLGSSSYFQVGGWGDISAEEFLEGSQRISEFCLKNGLTNSSWKINGYPLSKGPESEWGSEPKLAEELEKYCKQEGFQFVRLSQPDPNGFSELAFEAANYMIKDNCLDPAGVVIETFTQFDTQAAIRSSLLPLWLIFNTKDSLNHLEKMQAKFPPGKPVFFSPLATFSVTPDIVPWNEWERVLSNWDWINIGTRSSHYPSDSRALLRWHVPLRKWVKNHPQPISGTIDPETLIKISKGIISNTEDKFKLK